VTAFERFDAPPRRVRDEADASATLTIVCPGVMVGPTLGEPPETDG
jgi:hypothetical protein